MHFPVVLSVGCRYLRGHVGEARARHQNTTDPDIRERDDGRFPDADGFSVHETEERQCRAHQGEYGRLHELTFDDEHGDRGQHHPPEWRRRP